MSITITTKIKTIQEVEVDDIVLSFNIDTEVNEWQPVSELHRPIVNTPDQVFVSFENGGTIVTSKKHPMLKLTDSKWDYVATADIKMGDICKTENDITRVNGITIGFNEDEQFYDITVEGNNNFFAGDHASHMTVIHNSATVYAPIWHLEIEDLMVLKNNKGTEETRVRHLDYGFQINGFLYKRLLSRQDITLFSPDDVPELYEAFFADQELFAKLYEEAENDPNIRSRTIPAIDVFNVLVMERNNTGRIYIQNVDHCNTHGAFNPETSPIRMSNLCVEITLPTAPLTSKGRLQFIESEIQKAWDLSCKDFREEYGEIALCTLGSINWGMMNEVSDFKKPADLCVRLLDELLDYQDYPIMAAGLPAKKRRSLGIGVCNLAYFIAKNNHKYSDGSANELVNEFAEAMSYYLITASSTLAAEKGKCDWFDETAYSKGKLPVHTYKKEVDELCKISTPSHLDWDSVQAMIMKNGMRNSTVMALMPVESSSQPINATNGMEPPRSMVSIKASKNGLLKQVVPDVFHLKNKYEYLWDMPSTTGYLEISAIFQKWVDQSISTNTSYNPENYPNNKVPMSVLFTDLIYAYKLGTKTLYYQNTMDGSDEVTFEETEECESCKL